MKRFIRNCARVYLCLLALAAAFVLMAFMASMIYEEARRGNWISLGILVAIMTFFPALFFSSTMRVD